MVVVPGAVGGVLCIASYRQNRESCTESSIEGLLDSYRNSCHNVPYALPFYYIVIIVCLRSTHTIAAFPRLPPCLRTDESLRVRGRSSHISRKDKDPVRGGSGWTHKSMRVLEVERWRAIWGDLGRFGGPSFLCAYSVSFFFGGWSFSSQRWRPS